MHWYLSRPAGLGCMVSARLPLQSGQFAPPFAVYKASLSASSTAATVDVCQCMPVDAARLPKEADISCLKASLLRPGAFAHCVAQSCPVDLESRGMALI